MKTKILLIAALLILSSCSFFRVVPESDYSAQSLKQYENDGKYLVLHRGEWAWHIYDLSVGAGILKARLDVQLGYHVKYLEPKEKGLNRFDKGSEPEIINSVHIFTTDTSFSNLDTLVAIPVSSINAVKSYSYAQAASRASILVPVIVGPVALVVLAGVLAVRSFSENFFQSD